MGRRLVVVMLIAALIAGGVFYFARMMQQSGQPAVTATGPVTAPVQSSAPLNTTNVLVAAKDLPAGTLIQANMLVFRPWPTGAVDDASHIVEGKGTVEEFAGAVVRNGARSGEPVVRGTLIKRGESGFMAAVLRPGMRAVTMGVNENTGVAGFVFPGDRVDLVMTHNVSLPDSRGTQRVHRVSETIMRDIRIIAVDQRAGDQDQTPAVARGVTLEVSPEEAEKIALAQGLGELRLILRPLAKQAGEGGAEATAGAEAAPEVAADGQDGMLVSATPGMPASMDGRTFSLDSDISQIIAPPGGNTANSTGGGTVQVVRGQNTTESQSK